MTRSGTSLTTSIVAGLLGGATRPDATWCGSALPYPKDQRTTAAGYFERQACTQLTGRGTQPAARCPLPGTPRAAPEQDVSCTAPAQDVVSLNYWVLKELGHPWTKFSAGFASRPTLLAWGAKNESSARRRFELEAARVLEDMSSHAPGAARAWVLKDARFARTLPLWWPKLSQPVCIIPYRHPAEVASSSILRSVALWESYLVAALSSARALGCPTLLLPYHGWMRSEEAARAQLQVLRHFLRAAGVRGLDEPSPWLLNATIQRSAQHQHATRASLRVTAQLTASARCLWKRLNAGSALDQPASSTGKLCDRNG